MARIGTKFMSRRGDLVVRVAVAAGTGVKGVTVLGASRFHDRRFITVLVSGLRRVRVARTAGSIDATAVLATFGGLAVLAVFSGLARRGRVRTRRARFRPGGRFARRAVRGRSVRARRAGRFAFRGRVARCAFRGRSAGRSVRSGRAFRVRVRTRFRDGHALFI